MRNGIAKSVAAILVAGVLAAGVCCAGFAARDENGKWFGNGNLSTWHWKDKTDDNAPEKPDNKPDDKPTGDMVNADGAIIGEVENNGISLLSAKIPVEAYAANGINAQADTAYQLTATIEPVIADDKTVDWSVRWKDSESEWAQGKNISDYATVTPTSDGALTANVVFKRDFGAQIEVVVTSRDNATYSATCVCDYAKRVLKMSGLMGGYPFISFSSEEVETVYSYTSKMGGGSKTPSLLCNTDGFADGSFSAYTLDDTFEYEFEFCPTTQYSDLLKDSVGLILDYSRVRIVDGNCVGDCEMLWGAGFIFNGLSNYSSLSALPHVVNSAVQILRDNPNMRFMQLTMKATGRHSTFEKTVYYVADSSSLTISVTGVGLDKGHIIV